MRLACEISDDPRQQSVNADALELDLAAIGRVDHRKDCAYGGVVIDPACRKTELLQIGVKSSLSGSLLVTCVIICVSDRS